jgi:hypothetical protein
MMSTPPMRASTTFNVNANFNSSCATIFTNGNVVATSFTLVESSPAARITHRRAAPRDAAPPAPAPRARARNLSTRASARACVVTHRIAVIIPLTTNHARQTHARGFFFFVAPVRVSRRTVPPPPTTTTPSHAEATPVASKDLEIDIDQS